MKKYRISKSAVCVLFAVLFMFVVAISAYAVDIDGDGIDDGDIVETEVYTDPEYTEPYTEPETYPETEPEYTEQPTEYYTEEVTEEYTEPVYTSILYHEVSHPWKHYAPDAHSSLILMPES
mgnify:CR=1 FL=1